MVGVLTAVILVPANLQAMTDPLILPSRREHPQQSVDKDVEQLRGRDASLRYTCIKRDCCTYILLHFLRRLEPYGLLCYPKSAPLSQRLVYKTYSSRAKELHKFWLGA